MKIPNFNNMFGSTYKTADDWYKNGYMIALLIGVILFFIYLFFFA